MKKKKHIIDYKKGYWFMIFETLILLVVMLGGSLNFLAIQNNGGRMPFNAEYDYQSKTHFSFQEFAQVKLPFLTDIIHFLNGYWSIGDLIMFTGVFLLFLNAYLMTLSKWRFIHKIKN